MPERNPYLILGVDFGSDPDTARQGFARAARRLRQQGGGRWDQDDYTAAMHEIDALEENPADLVSIYRVPANATVFHPAGAGLFRPPAVPLERRTAPADPDALAGLRLAAAQELDELLAAACGAMVTIPPAYQEA